MKANVGSGNVESFLNFLRESQTAYSAAVSEQSYNDNVTQDILHAIEFDKCRDVPPSKLKRLLATARRRRRIAKNIIETAEPVVAWCDKHKTEIKELERLLGEMRQTERRIAGRVYAPRTKVLEDDVNEGRAW